MSGEVIIARERLTPAVWADLLPLMHALHDETRRHGDPELEVDSERFDAMDRSGVLRLYAARCSGRLVGFATFIVVPSARYRSRIIAYHDALYVKPEHRGACGVRLVRFADRDLAAAGVTSCKQSAKPESPFGALLDAVGYHVAEISYEKELRA